MSKWIIFSKLYIHVLVHTVRYKRKLILNIFLSAVCVNHKSFHEQISIYYKLRSWSCHTCMPYLMDRLDIIN